MKVKSIYGQSKINACISVIVELITYLSKFKNSIVLVGGWVPYFLYENIHPDKKQHVGSLDVDIALDFFSIPENDYQNIAEILEVRNYLNRKDRKGNIIPASYQRTFKDENSIEHSVQVDFLSGEYGGSEKNKRHQRIQDLLARKGRGVDLVFENCVVRKIEAHLPNGATHRAEVKIADLSSIITMKGFSFSERASEKDAYDIYWLFKNHPAGETGIFNEIHQMMHNKLGSQSMKLIKELFKSINSIGPTSVANFLEPTSDEERQIIIRDTFETVNRILGHLKV